MNRRQRRELTRRRRGIEKRKAEQGGRVTPRIKAIIEITKSIAEYELGSNEDITKPEKAINYYLENFSKEEEKDFNILYWKGLLDRLRVEREN